MTRAESGRASIEKIRTSVYRFPTPAPESDGTLTWDATTAVVVTLVAGATQGVGWTYSTRGAAAVIDDVLAPVVHGADASDVVGGWSAMRRAIRNLGGRGLAMQALSAVDIAWWDLSARLAGQPLATRLGGRPVAVPVYGSGGFVSQTEDELAEDVQRWQAAGCTAMKIKIGQDSGGRPDRDLRRVEQLRAAAGPEVSLMVDANGGYDIGAAGRIGAELDRLGVVWFEEPVSSDDLAGLAELRSRLKCDVAAGEYLSDVFETAAMLPAVDCLQLDVTRCGGYTGWFRSAALAQAANRPVSGHCAPALHAPVAAAVPNLRHVEWFADHARLEPLLADHVPMVQHGRMHPDGDRVGHGMTIADGAERWRIA